MVVEHEAILQVGRTSIARDARGLVGRLVVEGQKEMNKDVSPAGGS